jgi:uncharacterized protein
MNDTFVTHNEAEHRFEHGEGANLAQLQYVRRGDMLIFTHTEVPDEAEGQGIGTALAHAALEHASSAGMKVVPRCPFVARYMERHPEYEHLLKVMPR